MDLGPEPSPEDRAFPRVPRANNLCESDQRTSSHVEPPVPWINPATWIVDSSTVDSERDENGAKFLEVVTVFLREIDVERTLDTGRNPTFSVEVSPCVIDSIPTGSKDMPIEEGTSEFDHVHVAVTPLSVCPSTSSLRLNQVAEEKDVRLLFLGNP